MKISQILRTMVILAVLTLPACVGTNEPTGPIDPPQEDPDADFRAVEVIY